MRILFVHNGRERFVLGDLALLRRSFQITDWYQPTRRFDSLQLYRHVRAHDLVFCWFASWHSLAPVWLARRLGKPAVVVVGGYDTACLPQAGYGAQRGGLRRIVARSIVGSATHLLAFSESARREAITHAGADPHKTTTAYLAVEPLPIGPLDRRAPIALTVGNVWRENLLRKGLLPFVQAAAHLPEVRFILAGRWCDDSVDELRRAAGPNVELRGFVPDEELAALYAQAAVYVQPSLHEGFGLSVAEAMSAGCIPVVTQVGSLPEVVGDTGVCLASNNARQVAEGVQQGLSMNGQQRRRARDRVLRLFPAAAREQRLSELLQTLRRDNDDRVKGKE